MDILLFYKQVTPTGYNHDSEAGIYIEHKKY